MDEKLTVYVSINTSLIALQDTNNAFKLFESDPMPHTYLLAKKYVKTGVVAVLHHDEGVGREFQKAIAEFKSIFEEKTGINWDQRLNKLQQEKGSYTYTPPSGGKPVGLISFRPIRL